MAKKNRLAAIEETKIRAKIKEEARLIPKEAITAFLGRARENARSPFYIDGNWAYQSSGSFEKIFFSGALVLELNK
ncbi:MAG: hypothetical protein KAV41_02580 [Candidatus Pacebacteria bacterium]|nr:hypothetical protein [Candidatus Paceibacterota bacterium]